VSRESTIYNLFEENIVSIKLSTKYKAVLAALELLRGDLRLQEVIVSEHSNAILVFGFHPGLIETIRGALMIVLHSILTFEFVW
jgi:hypothetical protein